MDVLALQQALFDAFNKARAAVGLADLNDADNINTDMSSLASRSASYVLALPEASPDDLAGWVVSQIASVLESGAGGDGQDNAAQLVSAAMDKEATHLGLMVIVEESEVRLMVQCYYLYLRIEPLGPMIDNDMLLQGYIVGSNPTVMGPALCIVEKQLAEEWTEIMAISPDKMIITPPDAEQGEDETRFMVPITVPSEESEGASLRVLVYVQNLANIQYDAEPAEDFASREKRQGMLLVSVCNAGVGVVSEAWGSKPASPTAELDAMDGAPEDDHDMMGRFAHGEGREEGEGSDGTPRRRSSAELVTGAAATEGEEAGDVDGTAESAGRLARESSGKRFAALSGGGEAGGELEGLVVQDIHIATDYDDIVALQSEGYALHSLQVSNEGILSDQDFLWKFHVMARYGSRKEPGIEDIQWIKCLKSLGTLPTLPFYKIMHDYDLSSPEDDYSVYLAFRIGPNPRFQQLAMLCCPPDSEDHLQRYVTQHNAQFVGAPDEVDRSFDGICGLMMVKVDGGSDTAGGTARSDLSHDIPPRLTHSSITPGGSLERDDDGEGRGGGGEDEDSSDEDYNDEEEAMVALQQQISELEIEKQSLQNLNAELQKKVVLLMAREKALQGQTVAGRVAGSADVMAAVEMADATMEQSVEKEKQYQEVLQLIVAERGKLNKQLKEFDQLALDLQTRLDDKEFKAKGISTSFKQFKKEILEKAQNSRTGHHIPEKQIQQIEGMEAKYEEELEKVRLRNISLRTTHKKLERTLRAREQLAEGLHMIDFEQLKIENQTLNEKIEERNEDLSKLKRKKTTTVQVLTHTREKLRFVQQANQVQQEKLASVEAVITSLRNVVTNLKLERDAIRGENAELKAKQSFATSDLLLADYENRKHQVSQMEAAIEELRHRYQLLVKQVQTQQQLMQSKSSASTPWLQSERK